ncbi:hypothetical protein AC628_12140 [Bradyrhizobium sp. NAS96.2]|nr:hypothetical protein AC628_12140 [Bradyrhizobium sp. NAS96.2]
MRLDDSHDLVLAMFGVAVAAFMLFAGELYLVTRPDPPEIADLPDRQSETGARISERLNPSIDLKRKAARSPSILPSQTQSPG